MDSITFPERAIVASHLTAGGIATEYIFQSGVLMNLIQNQNGDNNKVGVHTSDWTLDQLYAICSLVKIQFVIIVVPHLLGEKKSVRLRQVMFEPFEKT